MGRPSLRMFCHGKNPILSFYFVVLWANFIIVPVWRSHSSFAATYGFLSPLMPVTAGYSYKGPSERCPIMSGGLTRAAMGGGVG